MELQAWNAVADSRWFNEKGASLQKQIHNPFVDSGPAPWVQRIIDQGDNKAWRYAIAYDKFYNFMSVGRFSLKDIWQDLNQMRKVMADEPQPGWLFTKLR